MTTLRTDVQDLYRETLAGKKVQRGASWEDVTERTETIAVRGGKPETLVVRATSHGPLVAGRMALKWTALDPSLLRVPGERRHDGGGPRRARPRARRVPVPGAQRRVGGRRGLDRLAGHRARPDPATGHRRERPVRRKRPGERLARLRPPRGDAAGRRPARGLRRDREPARHRHALPAPRHDRLALDGARPPHRGPPGRRRAREAAARPGRDGGDPARLRVARAEGDARGPRAGAARAVERALRRVGRTRRRGLGGVPRRAGLPAEGRRARPRRVARAARGRPARRAPPRARAGRGPRLPAGGPRAEARSS